MFIVLQQLYWLLGGRASISSFVCRCVTRVAAAKELMRTATVLVSLHHGRFCIRELIMLVHSRFKLGAAASTEQSKGFSHFLLFKLCSPPRARHELLCSRLYRHMFDAAFLKAARIANSLASTGTEWRFNPPTAPHFGGKWEAAVKSVKFHLRCLIGDSQLI